MTTTTVPPLADTDNEAEAVAAGRLGRHLAVRRRAAVTVAVRRLRDCIGERRRQCPTVHRGVEAWLLARVMLEGPGRGPWPTLTEEQRLIELLGGDQHAEHATTATRRACSLGGTADLLTAIAATLFEPTTGAQAAA